MDNRAADICRQMEEIRRTAGAEVETIVQSARTLSDWRYYVYNHPFLVTGAAAAIGYLLVPKKQSRAAGLSDDAKELAELLKKHHVSGVTVEGPPQGLVKTVIGLATPFLIRQAMNLAQNKAATFDWATLFGGKASSASATSAMDEDAMEQTFEEFNIPR
jgi:hypothetical protein